MSALNVSTQGKTHVFTLFRTLPTSRFKPSLFVNRYNNKPTAILNALNRGVVL
nr:MAG TPA: hypothetical protein [Caudoviricetes sp.]